MVQFIRAVYENGVLKPEGRLDLAEHQRVRISIERLEPASSEQRAAALRELFRLADSARFVAPEKLPTRDELHERR
ncbi:MAG: antitoxin family protein [Phycisphaeraceae bacterium]|nr:antitoxin family protein [Phycisphaeraceae bacterium]